MQNHRKCRLLTYEGDLDPCAGWGGDGPVVGEALAVQVQRVQRRGELSTRTLQLSTVLENKGCPHTNNLNILPVACTLPRSCRLPCPARCSTSPTAWWRRSGWMAGWTRRSGPGAARQARPGTRPAERHQVNRVV